MKIRFVSGNRHKVREVKEILSPIGVEVISTDLSIREIQTEDVSYLVRDKLLKAFKRIGQPVFVEHTGLYIKSINDLPGGLTQIFWDKLEAENFSSLFGSGPDTSAVAKTTIGYCDSKRVHLFEGDIHGSISPVPHGNRDFQWDCVFIPTGEQKTFSEMGSRKNDISMRKIACLKFSEYLSKKRK